MRILILGFGPLARTISNEIKKFPEYGFHKGIAIYHIHTRRNSLSYGKDLVVEIPDPHGDGYRTFKDGYQAVEGYSTTVSNYEPWLLEQAAEGAFHILIDCTPEVGGAQNLIEQIQKVAKEPCKVISPNKDGDIKAVINELRRMLDGGKEWKPVELSGAMRDRAESLWAAADEKMFEYHQKNRKRDIAHSRNITGSASVRGYSVVSVIPEFDRWLIDRFVVDGDKSDIYKRTEYYDKEHDCLIIEHEMLTWFFGWHHTEQLASKEFLEPKLEVESARYIKYLSDGSTHVGDPESKYAIEYVYRGCMEVTSNDGASTIQLNGSDPSSAIPYMPDINPPSNRKIYAGLETIIFTYKDM